MIPRVKTTVSYILIVVCLGIICFVAVSTLPASSLSLNVQNSGIDIHAEQVPLIDILRKISDEADIFIESRDPLTELVSLNLAGLSFEQCLRRLLGNRNYALTYKKSVDNQIVPASMHIYGTGSVTLIKPEPKPEPPSPPEDPMKRVDRKTFEQSIGDTNKLLKQIAAHFVSKGPEGSGIKLTRVSENAFFSSIGLKNGDFVQDVNGEPVESVEEFIDLLQAVIEERNMIRILRIKSNNQMDPIYIRLH